VPAAQGGRLDLLLTPGLYHDGMPRCALCLLPFTALTALAGPCENNVKPMQPAWTWTYRDTGKDGPVLYEMHRTLGSAGYTDTYTTPGKPPAPQSFRCENGAHISISAPSIGGAQITKLVVKGVSFPALPNWKPGFAWSYVMNLEGKKSGLGAGAVMTLKYRILGREKVTVPAGTFDAWKVELSGDVDAHVSIVPIRRKFNETQWVGENIGLIKIQREASVSELFTLTK
jgi:hypothetical protein